METDTERCQQRDVLRVKLRVEFADRSVRIPQPITESAVDTMGLSLNDGKTFGGRVHTRVQRGDTLGLESVAIHAA